MTMPDQRKERDQQSAAGADEEPMDRDRQGISNRPGDEEPDSGVDRNPGESQVDDGTASGGVGNIDDNRDVDEVDEDEDDEDEDGEDEDDEEGNDDGQPGNGESR